MVEVSHVRREVVDEASGYLKSITVTPTIYPHSLEFHNVDVQSTGQKADCGNIFFMLSHIESAQSKS